MTDSTCDVLVVAPHPDDAEIGCGGTILQLVDAGRTVVVADLTAGEMGTRGDPTTRAAEAAAAARILGLQARVGLGLPDTRLADDGPCCRAVIDVIRRFRPRLLLAPHSRDVHPDHRAAAAIVRRAYFLSGLRKVHPDLGPAHRPQRLLWYPGNDFVEPTVTVDISAVAARKLDAVRCYASQVAGDDRSHFVYRLDPIERIEVRDRYYGARIGVRAGEGFVADAGLAVASAAALLD